MYGMICCGVSLAIACASGARANSAGVTWLTRASVHCADRIVATRSWNGSPWSSGIVDLGEVVIEDRHDAGGARLAIARQRRVVGRLRARGHSGSAAWVGDRDRAGRRVIGEIVVDAGAGRQRRARARARRPRATRPAGRRGNSTALPSDRRHARAGRQDADEVQRIGRGDPADLGDRAGRRARRAARRAPRAARTARRRSR